MKIELEKIQLAPLNFEQIRMNGIIVGLKQKKHFPLNLPQIEMLELMSQSFSIYEIVQSYLQKKILISFSLLHSLILFLTDENLILNPNFASYFSNHRPRPRASFFSQIKDVFGTEQTPASKVEEELRKIPFLRSLEVELLDLFLKNMRVSEAPAGLTICKQGDHQRSLFVLLKGNASIYRKDKGRRQFLATLSEGSVFGEVGFFLGEPRTADVVTDEESVIVRLKYMPEIFDQAIQTATARSLQSRFWLIHALLKSEIFRHIPSDCFDALVFSGEIRKFPENTLVCREGESGDSCYIIVQGSAIVSQGGKTIRLLSQGDSFGEVALMATQGKRSATVQIQKEVLALEIQSEKFYKLLGLNLVLACEFENLVRRRLEADQNRN